MADTENVHKEDEETGGTFEPVIKLTEQVEAKTLEEDEDVLYKMRAKLFRFDSVGSEWKERGTGEVRLLFNRETQRVRVLMRREKTLKVCANHLITNDMNLQANIGSDRSWVWKVAADISDGTPTSETLAIRFGTSTEAGNFQALFDASKKVHTGVPARDAFTSAELFAVLEPPGQEGKSTIVPALKKLFGDAGETKAAEEPKAEETKEAKTEEAKDESTSTAAAAAPAETPAATSDAPAAEPAKTD